MDAFGNRKPGQLIPRSTRSYHRQKDSQIPIAADVVCFPFNLVSFFKVLIVNPQETTTTAQNNTSTVEPEWGDDQVRNNGETRTEQPEGPTPTCSEYLKISHFYF